MAGNYSLLSWSTRTVHLHVHVSSNGITVNARACGVLPTIMNTTTKPCTTMTPHNAMYLKTYSWCFQLMASLEVLGWCLWTVEECSSLWRQLQHVPERQKFPPEQNHHTCTWSYKYPTSRSNTFTTCFTQRFSHRAGERIPWNRPPPPEIFDRKRVFDF